MKRPVGVTILGVLAIVAGALELLGSLPYLGLTLGLRGFTGPLVTSTASFAMTVGVVMLLIGALEIAFGIGALRLSHWAWTFGVTLSVIAIVVAVAQMFAFGFPMGAILWAVIPIVILAYLYTHDVRDAFGHLPSSAASTGHPTPA